LRRLRLSARRGNRDRGTRGPCGAARHASAAAPRVRVLWRQGARGLSRGPRQLQRARTKARVTRSNRRRRTLMKNKTIAFAVLTASLLASGAASAVADDLRLAQGWYGPPRDSQGSDRDRYRGNWAVGTFRGQ